MMKRRTFGLVVGAAASPFGAGAQQPPKMLRVGVVNSQPLSSSPLLRAFEQRMAALGYHEGKNFSFEVVVAKSLEEYAQGFQRLGKMDVILASGNEIALKSALALPGAVPIVMIAVDYDPIARGYVKSLARPDGNVTGLYLQQLELAMKRIEIFKDALPDLQAATMFWDRASADQWNAARDVAGKLGIRLAGVELGDTPYDYERALTEAPAEGRGTLIMPTSPYIFADRAKLGDLTLRHRIVSIFAGREWSEAGGLLSYGASIRDMFAHAADYVDRIARGARPGDLPIEQPTKFELVVNLKTAKAIGVTLPPVLLARADEVIE